MLRVEMLGSVWYSKTLSFFFFFLLIRIVVSNICWVKGRMINCFTFESHVGTFVGSSVLGTGINNDDKKEHVVLKEFTG